MTSDRVGDFIVRLTNASAIGKPEVSLPYSAHLEAIAKKLKQLGFVGEISKEGEVKKTLTVGLLYDGRGQARIHGAKRISKPGRRLYGSHTDVHRVAGGTGSRLISSSAGILSDVEARKARVGGETLFEIW